MWEPIEEAYFPKLDKSNSQRNYGSRPENMIPSDMKRETDLYYADYKISDFDLFYYRIMEAVHSRSILAKNGTMIALKDHNGMDLIGNMVEANFMSINFEYYGSLHNMGHDVIAYIHDPNNVYLVCKILLIILNK